ncbi:MAG: hypothetical protein WCO23_01245 [bacterium]
MKINFHIADDNITEKDKTLIEQKLQKLKRFVKAEPLTFDLYITDEADKSNDRGIDKSVRLAAQFNSEQFFVENIDQESMRAFAFCYKKMEIALERYHEKAVDWKTAE